MSFAALSAIAMVCFSRLSRTPPHRPSIAGRIPILGYNIIITFHASSFKDIRFLILKKSRTCHTTRKCACGRFDLFANCCFFGSN